VGVALWLGDRRPSSICIFILSYARIMMIMMMMMTMLLWQEITCGAGQQCEPVKIPGCDGVQCQKYTAQCSGYYHSVKFYFIVQQKYLFIYFCVWSFVRFLFVYLFIRLFIYYKTHTKSISVNNDIKYKVLKHLKHQEVGWQIESIAEVISASDKHETKRYTSFTNSSSGSWCTVTDARYQL